MCVFRVSPTFLTTQLGILTHARPSWVVCRLLYSYSSASNSRKSRDPSPGINIENTPPSPYTSDQYLLLPRPLKMPLLLLLMLNGFLISGLTSFLRHIRRRHPTRVVTRQELIQHILTILNENLARPSVVSHRIIIGTTDTESSTPSSLKRHAAFQIVRGHVRRITRPWLSPPQTMSSLTCAHLQTSTPVIRFWASIFRCTRRQILLAAARTVRWVQT